MTRGSVGWKIRLSRRSAQQPRRHGARRVYQQPSLGHMGGEANLLGMKMGYRSSTVSVVCPVIVPAAFEARNAKPALYLEAIAAMPSGELAASESLAVSIGTTVTSFLIGR
jgi:hypothetical protein